jgi:Fe-S cluster assembly protein SufD
MVHSDVMTTTEPLDFRPTAAVLEAALDELDDLGASGGGAVDAATRRRALDRYLRFTREPAARAPKLRHDYRALAFDDLVWSSGRTRVAALPRARARADDTDAPALAIENAGGLVHAGSTYLHAPPTHVDSRITLAALADARREHPDRVAAVHGRIAPAADPFVALATAFQNCGAFVDVPAEIALPAPLQLLFLAKPGEASAVFPHVVVRIGDGAHATILERHVGSQEAFVCGVVEVELGVGASCDYVVVQRADDGARVIVTRAAYVPDGARIGWHVAELGGALVRTRIDADLAGAGASAEVNAFFFARGFDHADVGIAIDHGAERTASRTVVRSAATDRAYGNVAGTVRIEAGAHRAAATLRSDALVLSRDAHVDATPALEIAANDVSAYHAATIGSLDEDALFYVQTRGIARGIAQRMMALAFFEPALAGFPNEALRDDLRRRRHRDIRAVTPSWVSSPARGLRSG